MRDTKGCGEETSPLFRGDSLHGPTYGRTNAGALGAEPLGKCPVSTRIIQRISDTGH